MATMQELKRQNEALREQLRQILSSESEQKSHIIRLQDRNAKLVEEAKSLAETNQQLLDEKAKLEEELLKSRNELEALIRRIFGPKSERFVAPDQLKLTFDSLEEIEDAREGIVQAVEEQERTDKRRKRKPKRRLRSEIFPENLERKGVIFDLSDDEKVGLVRIGEDIQETAHYRRPKVIILRKIFPKYARPGVPDAGILQAPRPPALIAGDRYDTSFAAEIIAAKFSYHLPIYRQQGIFSTCGIELSRSTLLNIQEAVASAGRVLRGRRASRLLRRLGRYGALPTASQGPAPGRSE